MTRAIDQDFSKWLKKDERIDDLECNGYQIIQNPNKFCFGMDAVLLSGFAKANPKDHVVDLGTGTGIIPILMSAKTKANHFIGVEIQPESADMARRSVAMNELEQKIKIIEGDIKNVFEVLGKNTAAVVTCNPPYMTDLHGIKNPEEPKAIARHEILCTLEDVIRTASALLVSGGHFYMVHRPFRLAEIFAFMKQYKLEPKRMRLVHPYIDREPNMVLIDAVKGAKPRLTIESPLIVFNEQGVYSKEIQELYGYNSHTI